jgi:hypothetical protein
MHLYTTGRVRPDQSIRATTTPAPLATAAELRALGLDEPHTDWGTALTPCGDPRRPPQGAEGLPGVVREPRGDRDRR